MKRPQLSMNMSKGNKRAHDWGYAYRDAMHGDHAAADLRLCDRNATTLCVDRKTKGLAELEKFQRLSTMVMHDANQEMIDTLASVPTLAECRIWSGTAISFEILSNLKRLKKVWMRGNTKCPTVEGIATLNQITHLALIHFPKIREYAPLGALSELEALAIEGSWGPPVKINSLSFVARFAKLRALHLTATRVTDGKLAPICEVRGLEYLACGNQFTLEEFARAAKALPKLIDGCIEPYTELTSPCPKCRCPTTVLLLGKGGRVTCMSCNASGVSEHVAKFRALQGR